MSDKIWMDQATQAVSRRLEARGMKVSIDEDGNLRRENYAAKTFGGDGSSNQSFHYHNISLNGIRFARMRVHSKGRSCRMITIYIPCDSKGEQVFFECGRYSKRSPNVRKFGATIAKRLLPYGMAACLEMASEIHDS